MGRIPHSLEVKHLFNLRFHFFKLLSLLTIFLCKVVFKHPFLAPVDNIIQQCFIYAVLAVIGVVLGNQIDLVVG